MDLTRNQPSGQEMLSSNELLDLFRNKKIDTEWSFENYKPSETGKWTHNYHRYPAKFIPQLVEKLLDEYISISDAHINDPFYGCGTTVVTAISRGFKTSGTDINKIAYLITKVKATPIEPTYLERKIKMFLERLEIARDEKQARLFPSDKIEPLIPERHIDRINYWFTEENKIKLGKILRIIQEEQDRAIRDFLLVAFSHILKNTSLWLQKSTKPTRDLNKRLADPYKAISSHLKKMRKGNDEFYKVVPPGVRKNPSDYLNIEIGDARSQPVEDESVDLIITSSPYVTSYEYADLHQLSFIWLDLIDSLSKYKAEFIGTAHKRYEKKTPRSGIAQQIVSKMSKKSPKKAKEVEAFFVDMDEVFDESFRILKNGGKACFVIGNTRLKGVDILNAEVFAESMQYSGFSIENIIKRRIPSKILPQTRDEKTGRFASFDKANSEAYPVEYIVIGLKR